MKMESLYLLVPLAPLAGALIAGLFGQAIGRTLSHWVTILGVLVSTVASFMIFNDVMAGNTFDGTVYTWAVVGGLNLEVGFLIDSLTATMMVVVTFVSLMVYTCTISETKVTTTIMVAVSESMRNPTSRFSPPTTAHV